MRHYYLPIAAFAFVSFLFSCNKSTNIPVNKLAEKCEPYDQFAFQRSFPDRDFDWKGWKNAMADIRATTAAQAKSNDCEGSTGNWTQQGPSNVGARCNTLATKPGEDNTVLAGFSAGGIFKSTDGGTNWHPVFDDHLELSIGDITFDPSNPNVVYAGTGDPNIPAIVFNGNGIYKSEDSGETWHYLGLGEEGIISKVVVSPDASKTLFAAVMGNPYTPDEKRGIYKSKDGGLSWQRVLFVDVKAGASDLVQSPTNPNVLYASFWDRIRNNFESIIYGPNSKVFKSIDGGETWTQLGNGLPTGTMGRTGLAVSQQNPEKLYVLYVDSLSTPGGLYKTINGGDSWIPVNISSLKDACANFGWYFGKIRMNPENDEDLYFLAILLYRKPAGSSSWVVAGGGHADSHDLIFTPSGRRYWANDGGVYSNDPGQMQWIKSKNLPVTQFYHVSYNPHEPDVFWGGTQDNGVQKGVGGAGINNWSTVIAADGFHCAFDRIDPKLFWVEIQNGTIHKTLDGGATWQYGTPGLGTSDRCSWDAPFFLSRFGPNKLFAATYRVYVSSGSGWGAISPDLTDGLIYGPKFHTVSALQESPILSDKLMAGTSDGNVWRREPTSNWTEITGDLPDRFVTSVQLSYSNPQRLFVTHSGFRNDEFIPHVHRSDDNGASWIDISSNLPQIPVNDLFILPNHADSVLFVATDAGVYFSKNDGGNWARLGANMPVIPVFDLEENPVQNVLMAGTFARSIWTFPLDSVFAQQPTISVQVGGSVHTAAGDAVSEVHFGNVKSADDGSYQIFGLPGCSSYTVAPYRNDNPLNGLTTYDLVLMSKHILGIEPLGSPYKMIAADANRSNSLTTFDIVALRKLILGIDDTLAGNTSWRFIPESHIFPNTDNPFSTTIPEVIEADLQTSPIPNLNFIAVKVGDVNNTAVPNALGPLSDRTVGTWSLDVRDRAFQAAEKVEILFEGEMNELAALQFTLEFDTELLAFESVNPIAEGLSLGNFGANNIQHGRITTSISTTTGEFTGETALFSITFVAKKAGRLRHSLQLGDIPTLALAYREDGIALRPVLWPTETGNITMAPNPFGSEGTWLNIEELAFELPGSGFVFEIFDGQGKKLFSKYLTGTQHLHIGADVFPHAGVYYWRADNNGLAGKLVFIP